MKKTMLLIEDNYELVNNPYEFARLVDMKMGRDAYDYVYALVRENEIYKAKEMLKVFDRMPDA